MGMLYAAAYAGARGMLYGGAVTGCRAGTLCHKHVVHDLRVDDAIEFLLGSSGYRVLRYNVSYHSQWLGAFIGDRRVLAPRRIVSQNELEAVVRTAVEVQPPPTLMYDSTYLPLEKYGGRDGLDEFFSVHFLTRSDVGRA